MVVGFDAKIVETAPSQNGGNKRSTKGTQTDLLSQPISGGHVINFGPSHVFGALTWTAETPVVLMWAPRVTPPKQLIPQNSLQVERRKCLSTRVEIVLHATGLRFYLLQRGSAMSIFLHINAYMLLQLWTGLGPALLCQCSVKRGIIGSKLVSVHPLNDVPDL